MKEKDRKLVLGSMEIINRFVLDKKDPTFRVNFIPVEGEIFHQGEFDVKLNWNDPNSRLRKSRTWHAYVRFRWEDEEETRLRIWKIGQGTMRSFTTKFADASFPPEVRVTAQAVVPPYQYQHFLKIDEEDIQFIHGVVNDEEIEEMKKRTSHEEIQSYVDKHVTAMNRMVLGEKLGII